MTSPKNSVRLAVEAAYGHTGQYIGRVVGPHAMYGTELALKNVV